MLCCRRAVTARGAIVPSLVGEGACRHSTNACTRGATCLAGTKDRQRRWLRGVVTQGLDERTACEFLLKTTQRRLDQPEAGAS